MQLLLYNIGITLYHMAIRLAAPFNMKARHWVEGRKDVFTDLDKAFSAEDRVVWFHASSLGEFEQGRPVMERLREEGPEYKILLTFFSPSGYRVRKDYPGAHHVCYLPRESKRNVRRFLDLARPEMAFFVKYEFWYHYLNELHKRQVPTVLFSALFWKELPFFRWYGGLYRQMLDCYSHIFVQDENSYHLLKGIGTDHVDIAGDTRFDRVKQIAQKRENYLHPDCFADTDMVIAGGSVWPPDEELLLELINTAHPMKVKFIVAPHEIREDHMTSFESRVEERRFVRYSQLPTDKKTEADIIIIDNIGMLSSLYGHAHIALIGGGFGQGIHNVLEAAVYGIPVLFGPRHGKFREAVELVRKGGAFPVGGKEDFMREALCLMKNKKHYKQAAQKAKQYVEENLGASEKILQLSLMLRKGQGFVN